MKRELDTPKSILDDLPCGCGGLLEYGLINLVVYPSWKYPDLRFEIDVPGWRCNNLACELQVVEPQVEDDIYLAMEQFVRESVRNRLEGVGE